VKPNLSVKPYTIGEKHLNQYTGMSIIEILDGEKKRSGWIWTTSIGKVIVSPHLGHYIWYNEGGEDWTTESGALWLVKKR